MSDSEPLRLVVFDVDGTLIDSQAHIMAAMTLAFEAVGHPCPPRPQVLSMVGLSLAVMMPKLAPGLDAQGHDALAAAYKASFADIRMSGNPLETAPLFPGAREVLDHLLGRDDLLVGIATGKSRRGLDHLLEAHGLTGAFVTEQVADHHPSKPHPSMLFTAMAETGVEAPNAVMIGDTTFDIEMGRAAGLRTIGVGWGYHPTEALVAAGADEVVASYAALTPALHKIWEG
ncbi:HAD-IA family hydrolase [Aliiruegeria lutimaris]|uniref:Phosphoglycolate phosphatase n=1 Tax=Aliiruegeria lutimaris TaxID=571298 RepID=A0A1G9H913_9RHOB|nr:HAD-IA family hydrolase [Aliiruegeria lutimaris]SDL09335.1 phosphoglycolate phosphatase [Aliiruegeria lutimaris]